MENRCLSWLHMTHPRTLRSGSLQPALKRKDRLAGGGNSSRQTKQDRANEDAQGDPCSHSGS
jgi:hypothetical protein